MNREIFAEKRDQLSIFLGISLLMLIFTVIVVFSTPLAFEKFIGPINPILLLGILIPTGFMIMTHLMSKGWFTVFKKENLRGALWTYGVAVLLALVMIVVDLNSPFPEDTNIPVPSAFLFYPAIGYIVEMLFHLVLLAALIIGISFVFRNVEREKIIWLGIVLMALFEPVYQMAFGAGAAQPLWQIGYTGFHVFVINFMEMYNFKKYDFVSMFSFRLVYYLCWHIIWGVLRLGILF